MTQEFGLLWFVDESETQRRRFYISLASAKRWNPSLNATVIYKGLPLNSGINEIKFDGSGERFLAKFQAWLRTPYERTLFLDNDTIVMKPLDGFLWQGDEVVAMPYPNMLSSSMLPREAKPLALTEWRNVNSGVISFPRSFLPLCQKVFDQYHAYVNLVPGKDQYFISYILQQYPELLKPSFDIQVTTTPFAVDYLKALKGVRDNAMLGIVPLCLIFDAHVFHYTHNKELYEGEFLSDNYQHCLNNRTYSHYHDIIMSADSLGDEKNLFACLKRMACNFSRKVHHRIFNKA